MVKYKKGDLLQATEDIIAHGCNCSGGFGSGVAGQIAKKYPYAREDYLSVYSNYANKGELMPLGMIISSDQPDGKIVVNCTTQLAYLPRGVCHADYEAIRTCMARIKEWASIFEQSIAIPKIGAGLAGGDWAVIEQVLNEVFNDYDVTVYEL